jgi:hypothetical protein
VQAAAAAAAAMASTAKTVKDVPSHDFVRAYAAHLKRSGKVSHVEIKRSVWMQTVCKCLSACKLGFSVVNNMCGWCSEQSTPLLMSLLLCFGCCFSD